MPKINEPFFALTIKTHFFATGLRRSQMKLGSRQFKFRVGLGALCWLLSLMAFGKPSEKRKLNVHVNPVPLAVGGIEGGVDWNLGGLFYLGGRGGYFDSNIFGQTIKGKSVGVSLGVLQKGQRIRNGWYSYLLAEWRDEEVTEKQPSTEIWKTTQKSQKLSTGILGGYQFIWASGFNISVGSGFSYQRPLKSSGEELRFDGSIQDKSVKPSFGLTYDLAVGFIL